MSVKQLSALVIVTNAVPGSENVITQKIICVKIFFIMLSLPVLNLNYVNPFFNCLLSKYAAHLFHCMYKAT